MKLISFSVFPGFELGGVPASAGPPLETGPLPDPGSLLPDGVPVLPRGPSVETGSMLAPGSFTGDQLGKSAHRLCQTTDIRPDGVAACLPACLPVCVSVRLVVSVWLCIPCWVLSFILK